MTPERDDSRRSFLKKAAYTAPLILTLKADPAFASYGSGKPPENTVHGNNGVGNGLDPAPPGNPRPNDGAGTGPGAAGNRP